MLKVDDKVPLVSIVLCSYNGQKYIKEQIECLIEQTYSNIEIVVCDDASSDRTVEIITSFALKDSRIRLFCESENVGYNKNFERACAQAKGEYIAISDQDDIWDLQKIEKLMKLWIDKDVILVHSAYASFYTHTQINYKHKKLRKPFTGNELISFFIGNHITGHNMLFKRELLELILPFPKGIYYDWWIAGVAVCNGRINATEDTLTYHRLHETNVSGSLESNRKLYEFIINATQILLKSPGISASDVAFGEVLVKKLSTLNGKIFSIDVFLFILRNSKILNATKKRLFPFFSNFRTALRIAYRKTAA